MGVGIDQPRRDEEVRKLQVRGARGQPMAHLLGGADPDNPAVLPLEGRALVVV
jgi:hypothetical protein